MQTNEPKPNYQKQFQLRKEPEMLTRRSTHEAATHPNRASSERWIREGWSMAAREEKGAFESIEIKHEAENSEHVVLIQNIKVKGHVVLERRDRLQQELAAVGFDRGSYPDQRLSIEGVPVSAVRRKTDISEKRREK
jgi:hypothetical protein